MNKMKLIIIVFTVSLICGTIGKHIGGTIGTNMAQQELQRR